jgi:hypothetical protein
MKGTSLLSVLLILLLTSCRKEPKQYDLPQGVKTYFGYKNGSSWVYKDSIKGTTDSFVLNGVNDDYITGKPGFLNITPGNKNEYLHLEMRNYSTLQGDWIEIKITNNKNYYSADLTYGGNDFSEFISGWPFTLTSADTNIRKELLPNVVVDGRSYNDVYHYTYRHDSLRRDELLINADNGLIKLKVGADSTLKILELQRSNIIR